MTEENLNRYNEEFAIPEMIKTFKVLCNRLQKDILFILLIVFYIYSVQVISIPGFRYDLVYEGKNIIYVFVVFFLFYLFVMMHMSKIYILYRQIDNEVKIFYSHANKDFDRALESSSHMTAFVISENIISDFVLAGHKRHPSLRRFIVVQMLILVVAIILTYTMTDDFLKSEYVYSKKILIVSIVLGYLLLFYIVMKYYFIERSAFLQKASIGKIAIGHYYNLLSLLNRYSTRPSAPQKTEFMEKMEGKYNNLKQMDIANIFDGSWSIDFLEKNSEEIKDLWDKLSDEEIRDINSFIVNRGVSFGTNFQILFESIANFKNASDYNLAFSYHTKNVKQKPDSFRGFLKSALIG